MQLWIQPLDTQFYRSGLPFDAGLDSNAFSLFPPWPRTLYGALRTEGLSHKGISFKASWPLDPQWGGPSSFGSVVMRGPILATFQADPAQVGTFLLPFPFDLARVKDSPSLKHLTPCGSLMNSCTDLATPPLYILSPANPTGDVLEEVDDYWMEGGSVLTSYLCQKMDKKEDQNIGHRKEQLFTPEPRIGITRNKQTGTAATHLIYQVQHYRLAEKGPSGLPVGFLTELDNPNPLPNEGLLRLGGEGRPAAYRKLDEMATPWWSQPKTEVVNLVKETGQFKAFFLTPALFQQGAIPDRCTKQEDGTITGTLSSGVSFSLIGACLGKKEHIGGWDMKGNCPKPMRAVVPAGSVYFFRFYERDWQTNDEATRRTIAEALWDELHFQPWCSQNPWEDELGPGKEGFGLAMIGGWK